MKLNLECGNDLRNGYVNVNLNIVDLQTIPQNTRFVVGNYRNLDPIVKDGQADEIIFNPFLNKIGPAEAVGILAGWNKKLKNNGLLKLNFVDIRRLGRILHSGALSLQDAHMLIFGTPAAQHYSIIDVDVLKNLVQTLGMRINSISAKDIVVTVELKKNVEN